MVNDEVPADIRRLLYERVATYEQLEVLLWLVAEHPSGAPLEVVASVLGASPAVAEEALSSLVEAELVDQDEAAQVYRYEPVDEELDAVTRRLALTYRANRFAVVKAMTDNSMQRLRSSTLHLFAECFLIGGPKKDG